ncbi:nucleolar GTP-binding protein 1 [Platysternon megacephalum]|uniref:Nucleolar GTP-binding protein 1 n=1 Tax=Platysternon megacephalum TaxID=55544 RepID=A0A4D9EQY6_9SAUR|nr:nucleolar GTP-binding protein 1 [Platysternon megacephalum]
MGELVNAELGGAWDLNFLETFENIIPSKNEGSDGQRERTLFFGGGGWVIRISHGSSQSGQNASSVGSWGAGVCVGEIGCNLHVLKMASFCPALSHGRRRHTGRLQGKDT